MEQADIFSRKIRRLAIATGVASTLALFPILFLLYPALLIVGGIIQPRFPTTGKWLVWAGAANLGVVVIIYDAMFFQPSSSPDYMVLTFSAATVLLVWCSVELAADGLRRMRARRSMPPAAPRPVSLGAWIFAVVLNVLVGWEATGWALGPSVYRSSANFYSALAMSLVQAATVVAFDIWLVRQAFNLRRARRADS